MFLVVAAPGLSWLALLASSFLEQIYIEIMVDMIVSGKQEAASHRFLSQHVLKRAPGPV